ncbi:MAG: biotin--[acetyl-CoA-carboxylase] ligase [Patulibacter sp.]|nr:biotin--[acetyl-CoA-carboxylase] ligase [Patulibacter sp.]
MSPVDHVSEESVRRVERLGGWPLHRFSELGSTNDEARRLASGGAPHGTVVVARNQTAGHGRAGRPWIAPAGETLCMSIVVRDQVEWTILPLVAAVAVAETVGAQAAIKWPNDVVFAEAPGAGRRACTRGAAAARGVALRKVAGILCTGVPHDRWAVVGIGLNVALDLSTVPAEIAERAATMGREPSELDDVLAELVDRFHAALALPFLDLLEAWSERDVLLGATVGWDAPGAGPRTGTARGIDARGRLRVKSAHGTVAYLDAGEVHLRSTAGGVLEGGAGEPW